MNVFLLFRSSASLPMLALLPLLVSTALALKGYATTTDSVADTAAVARRWQGWDTTTVTVTASATSRCTPACHLTPVISSRDVPDVVTIWTTFGEAIVGATQTQTVYEGTITFFDGFSWCSRKGCRH